MVGKKKSAPVGASSLDPGSAPVPEPPATINDLFDAPMKNRAVRIWQDSHRLRIALDMWQQWFRDLDSTRNANPAIPLPNLAVPLRCDEVVTRCLEVLWPYLVQVVPNLGGTLRELKARLPHQPSGRLAATDVVLGSEAKTLVEVERVGWQHEPELWNSYYGGDLNSGSGAMYSLYGGASELLRMLSHDPASFFRNMPDSGPETRPTLTSPVGDDVGVGTVNAAVKGADKRDGQTDTVKKSVKKARRRQPNQHSKACVRKFKEYKKHGDPQSMRYVVKEYVSENEGLSESSLYRTLTDNSDQWKM